MVNDVAILILNYNSKRFLKDCISSFKSQSYKNIDIYLVDNNSTDDSVKYVKKEFPSVRIIENTSNLWVGGGFNRAIKLLENKYTYFAFFNPDVYVYKQWVKETRTTLELNPSTQVCTGLIISWDRKRIENAGGIILNVFTGIFGGILSHLSPRTIPVHYRKKNFPVFFGVLTAMMVRSSAFKKYGHFDDRYLMSSEEADFCWRIWLAGDNVLSNTQAITRHHIHGSNPNKKASLTLYMRTETNLLLTYYKNLSSPTFLLLIIPLLSARLLSSLLYIFIDPEITVVKIKGILLFFRYVIQGTYIPHRKYIASLRKKSDWEVLRNNPTPLFSIRPVLTPLQRWYTTIRNEYKKAKIS